MACTIHQPVPLAASPLALGLALGLLAAVVTSRPALAADLEVPLALGLALGLLAAVVTSRPACTSWAAGHRLTFGSMQMTHLRWDVIRRATLAPRRCYICLDYIVRIISEGNRLVALSVMPPRCGGPVVGFLAQSSPAPVGLFKTLRQSQHRLCLRVGQQLQVSWLIQPPTLRSAACAWTVPSLVSWHILCNAETYPVVDSISS